MNKKIEPFLEKIGLTKNEAKVYVTTLQLGQASVAKLARMAAIHRVAAYPLVESLVKKGLLTMVRQKGGYAVIANHPRQFQSLIDDEKLSLRKVEIKYSDILPDLLAIFNKSNSSPTVKYFEGVQGLAQINTDILHTLSSLPEKERITYSYSNPNILDDRFEEYMNKEEGYINRRIGKMIRNKVIALDGPITRDIAKRDEQELREMIILSPSLFPFKNDITIYSNKIAIDALQHELVGVIIESAEIVEDQIAIFNLAWEGAKVISGKK